MPEATNCSPSPRPTISGHSLRAPTTARLVGGGDDERVVAAQAVVGAPRRLDQAVLVEVARDQVRDHLDVRLRREDRAVGEQLLLELEVVLDDPVDDHVDAVVRVVVRVRVLLGDAPVRGPARVPDAGRRRRGEHRHAAVAGRRGHRLLPAREVPDGADRLQPTLRLDRDSGRVVPAVLKLLEPVEEDVLHRPMADVPNDAAHGRAS
jgi:hypothetical protein